MSIETIVAAVQHVRAVVGIEPHLSAIKHEPRAGDAVGIAPDGRAEEPPRGEIACEIVMAKHDILALPGAVGRGQREQRRAMADDSGFETVRPAQRDALDHCAIGHHTERRAVDTSNGGLRHG